MTDMLVDSHIYIFFTTLSNFNEILLKFGIGSRRDNFFLQFIPIIQRTLLLMWLDYLAGYLRLVKS